MDKVLLVIPAYNEGKNIERVVDHIKNDFPELDYEQPALCHDHRLPLVLCVIDL